MIVVRGYFNWYVPNYVKTVEFTLESKITGKEVNDD